MHLDFHGLISVDAENASADVRRVLARDFGRFAVQSPATAPAVVLENCESCDLHPEIFELRKQVRRFHVLPGDGGAAIVLTRRMEPEAAIIPGDPVLVRHVEGTRSSGRILDALTLAVELALESRGGMLFKGAALVRGGRALVLTGPSGAGKTTVSLGLLLSGWDYLSNNLFILKGGKALQFERHLVFHIHHLGLHPELFSHVPRLKARMRWAGPRVALRDFCRKRVPPPIMNTYKFKRFCDPFLSAQPEELLPGRPAVDAAATGAWIMLQPGRDFALAPIARGDAVRRFSRVMSLSHEEWAAIRAERELLGDDPGPSFSALLDANLQGECFAATIPPGMPIRELDAAFAKALGEVLT